MRSCQAYRRYRKTIAIPTGSGVLSHMPNVAHISEWAPDGK